MARNQITISTKGTNQLLRKLERMGPAARDAASKVVTRGVFQISADAKRFATDSSDTGRLRDSIAPDVKRTNRGTVGRVEAHAKYASAVEFGTRPHFPPVDALRDWARRRLGDENLAFVVARAISERGTKAQPFMRPAFNRNRKKIEGEFRREIKRAVTKDARR